LASKSRNGTPILTEISSGQNAVLSVGRYLLDELKPLVINRPLICQLFLDNFRFVTCDLRFVRDATLLWKSLLAPPAHFGVVKIEKKKAAFAPIGFPVRYPKNGPRGKELRSHHVPAVSVRFPLMTRSSFSGSLLTELGQQEARLLPGR